MLTVTSTAIDGVKVVTPNRLRNSRGGSSAKLIIRGALPSTAFWHDFVQDNQSASAAIAHSFGGLHFQGHPLPKAKLIPVLKGRIFDVAVDLRRSSPTYGKWVAEEASAENRKQVFIPIDFARGFCTLEIDTHVFYKVSAFIRP